MRVRLRFCPSQRPHILLSFSVSLVLCLLVLLRTSAEDFCLVLYGKKHFNFIIITLSINYTLCSAR